MLLDNTILDNSQLDKRLISRVTLRSLILLLTLLSLSITPSVGLGAGSDTATDKGQQTLEEELRALKLEVIELNRDLLVLEEQLLYPAETQVAVFLSLNSGHYFKLDAVELQINGKIVTSQLYTDHQIDALKRGGMQRLYTGNLKSGSHQLVAMFTGIGPENREYRRAAKLDFDKTSSTAVFEIKIEDNVQTQQPDFIIKEWDTP